MKRVAPIVLICLFFNPCFANEDKKESINNFSKTRFQNIDLFNKVLYLIEKNYYREILNAK